MALIPLLRYPDPPLKQMALPVERVTDEINALITDLFETMYAAPGVGMTACHAGILKRIVVLKVDPKNPSLAARLLGSFETWKRLDSGRQAKVEAELKRILATAGLSKNAFEIASKTQG